MYFRVGEFVPEAKIVAIYSYEECDSFGNVLSSPTSDFLNALFKSSPLDAQILKSQILNTANIYGLGGRNENSDGREGLFAIPSKYDEDGNKITSKYRLYYWVLNGTTILLGGGCHKPEKLNGEQVKDYQSIPECETAAAELANVAKHLEALNTRGEIFIEDRLIVVDFEEILEI